MIAKGNRSTDSGSARKLYIGMGAVKVLAVNPNKKQLEEIYGRELEKEPEYLSTQEIDGKQVPVVRISFVVTTDPEKNDSISLTANHVFFLKKTYVKGSQSGKYKVIDKYGRTVWVTKEQATEHAIPEYSNGPANIDADYRGCYEGEEELTMFIKNLLVIPNVSVYQDGKWKANTKVKAEDCEVRFDTIDDFFKGNLKELKDAISYLPENLVKIPFGVRTDTDSNRQLQTTYTKWCCKNSVTDYSKFAAEIANSKEAGRLSTVEFDTCELKEYEVDPTNLSPTLEEVAQANIAGEETPW